MVRAGAMVLFIWALRLMEMVTLISFNSMITIGKAFYFKLSSQDGCAKAKG